MTQIRILLADDHPAILAKVKALLEGTFEIVGIVRDGQAAVDEAVRHCPDVVLMDISMPILSGTEATEQLIRANVKTKIVFLTVHEDPDFVKAALATGAAGYVVKSHMASDLFPAIRAAIAGHRFVSPCVRAKDKPQNTA